MDPVLDFPRYLRRYLCLMFVPVLAFLANVCCLCFLFAQQDKHRFQSISKSCSLCIICILIEMLPESMQLVFIYPRREPRQMEIAM